MDIDDEEQKAYKDVDSCTYAHVEHPLYQKE